MADIQGLEIGGTIKVGKDVFTKQYVSTYHRILWENIAGHYFTRELPEGIDFSSAPSDHLTVIYENDEKYNGAWLTGDEAPKRLGEKDVLGEYQVSLFKSENNHIVYVQGKSSAPWYHDGKLYDAVAKFIKDSNVENLPIHYEQDWEA